MKLRKVSHCEGKVTITIRLFYLVYVMINKEKSCHLKKKKVSEVILKESQESRVMLEDVRKKKKCGVFCDSEKFQDSICKYK